MCGSKILIGHFLQEKIIDSLKFLEYALNVIRLKCIQNNGSEILLKGRNNKKWLILLSAFAFLFVLKSLSNIEYAHKVSSPLFTAFIVMVLNAVYLKLNLYFLFIWAQM